MADRTVELHCDTGYHNATLKHQIFGIEQTYKETLLVNRLKSLWKSHFYSEIVYFNSGRGGESGAALHHGDIP